jgi:uncharacterized membrane protein
MNLRPAFRTAGGLLGVMTVFSLWGITQASPDSQVAIHWGLDGQPDGFASAWIAFLLIPLTTLGLLAIFAVVPRIEPQRVNLARSALAYRTVMLALTLLLFLLNAAVVLIGLGHPMPIWLLAGVGTGLFFMAIGSVTTGVRRNYTFGVRTPWTLASDLAWDRTHRVVGRLFIIGGVIMVLVGLTQSADLLAIASIAFIIAVMVIAFAYSYLVWKNDPDRRPLDGAA